VATEKSKIQEWPFAGVSRGHTVVLCRAWLMHRLVSPGRCMSCERRGKICSKTGQKNPKISASGGGPPAAPAAGSELASLAFKNRDFSHLLHLTLESLCSVIVSCVCVSRARRVGFFAYF